MYVNFNRAPRLLSLRISCTPSQVNDMVAVYQAVEAGPYITTGSLTEEDPNVQVLRIPPESYITSVSGLFQLGAARSTSLASLKIVIDGNEAGARTFGRPFGGAVPRDCKPFNIRVPRDCVVVGFFGGRRRVVNLSNRVEVGPMHTIGAYFAHRDSYTARQRHVWTLPMPSTSHLRVQALLQRAAAVAAASDGTSAAPVDGPRRPATHLPIDCQSTTSSVSLGGIRANLH